ncbi:Fis family transcriptional regulator, partial [Achromobacter dolens]
LTHDWPGNVRELAHFAERFVLGVLNTPTATAPEPAISAGTLPEKMERFEAQLIREALAAHRGDVRATLEALG